MDKYEKIEVVGEGSYGIVIKCKHRESGQVVAIKKFLETEEDHTVRKMALREIRMLKKLRHENLVSMIEVFRRNRRFYLVFEFMDHTILDELEENTSGLGDEVSRQHIYQVIRGVDYCHTNKVIHRDLKPENVLVSRLGVIKLCDFGFARLLTTQGETYTDYVATRWYRAPELLVGDTKYGREVDVWAIGCMFAEMLTGDPLFPGESDIDQLFQITKLLGRLSTRHQQLLTRNPAFKGMMKTSNEEALRSLSKTFPSWAYLALDLTSICLKLDPVHRPSCRELLHHPYFIHDNFVERFLPDLRSKVQQEFQGNPLLRKFSQPNYVLASAARRSRERVSGDDASNKSMTYLQRRGSFMEPPRWKVNLTSQQVADPQQAAAEPRRVSVDKSRPIPVVLPRRRQSDNGTMDVTEENNNNNAPRNDAFRSSNANGASFKPTPLGRVSDNQCNLTVGVSPPSPSPPPFQSLQTSGYGHSGAGDQCAPHPAQHAAHGSLQVLHPTINNLSFGAKENAQHYGGGHIGGSIHGNMVGNVGGNLAGIGTGTILGKMVEPLKRSPQPLASRPRDKAPPPPNPSLIPRTHLVRRLDRTTFVDVGHLDMDADKWHHNGGRKQLGAIRTNENAAWRANKPSNDDFSLPNVPGASGSPSKITKKKLSSIHLHSNDAFISPNNTTSRPPSQSPKTRFSSKNFPFV